MKHLVFATIKDKFEIWLPMTFTFDPEILLRIEVR